MDVLHLVDERVSAWWHLDHQNLVFFKVFRLQLGGVACSEPPQVSSEGDRAEIFPPSPDGCLVLGPVILRLIPDSEGFPFPVKAPATSSNVKVPKSQLLE